MSKKVKIYTTPTCSYCQMAKGFFKKNNIAYEEYDLTTNLEAAREMVARSGQYGVPVIDIDGKIIVGFDAKALEKYLAISDKDASKPKGQPNACCC